MKQQWDRYAEAVADYEVVVHICSSDNGQLAVKHNYHSLHKAHVSIGWCYEKMGCYEKAIEGRTKGDKVVETYRI